MTPRIRTELYFKEFLDALLSAKVSYGFICVTPKAIRIAGNSSYVRSLSKTSGKIDVILVDTTKL